MHWPKRCTVAEIIFVVIIRRFFAFVEMRSVSSLERAPIMAISHLKRPFACEQSVASIILPTKIRWPKIIPDGNGEPIGVLPLCFLSLGYLCFLACLFRYVLFHDGHKVPIVYHLSIACRLSYPSIFIISTITSYQYHWHRLLVHEWW